MREYTVIRDEVSKLGATLVEEHLHPQSFGSAYCVFAGRTGKQFRFVWDGKEEYGFLEFPSGDGSWSHTKPFVNDVSNPKFGRFAELLAIAQSEIDSA
jgi:hypothetical protein